MLSKKFRTSFKNLLTCNYKNNRNISKSFSSVNNRNIDTKKLDKDNSILLKTTTFERKKEINDVKIDCEIKNLNENLEDNYHEI
jgi:hypothetical protein